MLRALLTVARHIDAAYDIWRSRAAPRRPTLVELSVLRERLERVRAENDLLRARLRRLKPRKRPHYKPFERLAILWHAARHGMSIKATAKAFVVTRITILNWRRSVRSHRGPMVAPQVPVNRLPDLVADVAKRIKREWPRWGTRRIAGVLARMGLKTSRSTVQAFLRRPAPPPRPSRAAPIVRPRHVVAKGPGHVWFIDFTKVGGLLRSVMVGAIIDGFSRKVLAVGVTHHEPTAEFAIGLLREAIDVHGAPPKYVVSDHGPQLTADDFQRAVRRNRIGHRFGAVHRSGSLALIERFWKSFKTEYAGSLVLYRPLRSIESKLRAYAAWFNAERPHQGLDQRTPDEVHFDRDSRAKSVPLDAVLAVTHLRGDFELPVLSLRRAA